MNNSDLRGCVPVAALLFLAAQPAPASESPWRLGLALGYGERSNPLVQQFKGRRCRTTLCKGFVLA